MSDTIMDYVLILEHDKYGFDYILETRNLLKDVSTINEQIDTTTSMSQEEAEGSANGQYSAATNKYNAIVSENARINSVIDDANIWIPPPSEADVKIDLLARLNDNLETEVEPTKHTGEEWRVWKLDKLNTDKDILTNRYQEIRNDYPPFAALLDTVFGITD